MLGPALSAIARYSRPRSLVVAAFSGAVTVAADVAAAQILRSDGQVATIRGGPDADTLKGPDGDDVIHGDGGDDVPDGDIETVRPLRETRNVFDLLEACTLPRREASRK